MKKYCECYSAGIICSDNCRCSDCENHENNFKRIAKLSSPLSESAFNKKAFVETAQNILSSYSKERKGFGISGKRHALESELFKNIIDIDDNGDQPDKNKKTPINNSIININIDLVQNFFDKEYIKEKQKDAKKIAKDGENIEENLLLFFVNTLKEINKSLSSTS